MSLHTQVKSRYCLPNGLGWLEASFNSKGFLVRLGFIHSEASEETLVTFSHPSSHRSLHFLKQQLADYFRGTCRTFNIPLHLAGNPLQNRVWEELLLLPFGQGLNLADLSTRIGGNHSLLELAEAIRDCPIAVLVPIHRVLGWESLVESSSSLAWVGILRRIEDFIPGESTCILFGALPEKGQKPKVRAD